MIDSKLIVGPALAGDPALADLLGHGERVFYWQKPTEKIVPCVVYREEDNAAAAFADNLEIGSELIVSVDVFAKGNTFAIADRVNAIMAAQGFTREYARDLYREGDYQKHMRFRGIRRT